MDGAIEEFWSFWRSSESGIERSIEERTLDRWVGPIGERSMPSIQSSRGSSERVFARITTSVCRRAGTSSCGYWRSAGEPPGPVTGRPSSSTRRALEVGSFPDQRLAYAGIDFGEGEFRVALRRDDVRARIHVSIHHPSFAAADEDTCLGVTWLMLDSVLGEDEVERWVGKSEVLEEPPDNPVDFGSLVAAVADLRATSKPNQFTLLRGRRPSGATTFALVNLALKKIDHLFQDVHYEISLPLRTPTPQGLTTQEEGDELNSLEDELTSELGADAVLVGHETHEALRLIHLHASATGPVPARLDAWCARIAPREVVITATHDPGWSVLSRC